MGVPWYPHGNPHMFIICWSFHVWSERTMRCTLNIWTTHNDVACGYKIDNQRTLTVLWEKLQSQPVTLRDHRVSWNMSKNFQTTFKPSAWKFTKHLETSTSHVAPTSSACKARWTSMNFFYDFEQFPNSVGGQPHNTKQSTNLKRGLWIVGIPWYTGITPSWDEFW